MNRRELLNILVKGSVGTALMPSSPANQAPPKEAIAEARKLLSDSDIFIVRVHSLAKAHGWPLHDCFDLKGAKELLCGSSGTTDKEFGKAFYRIYSEIISTVETVPTEEELTEKLFRKNDSKSNAISSNQNRSTAIPLSELSSEPKYSFGRNEEGWRTILQQEHEAAVGLQRC